VKIKKVKKAGNKSSTALFIYLFFKLLLLFFQIFCDVAALAIIIQKEI
jgi:hypothetical protein